MFCGFGRDGGESLVRFHYKLICHECIAELMQVMTGYYGALFRNAPKGEENKWKFCEDCGFPAWDKCGRCGGDE